MIRFPQFTKLKKLPRTYFAPFLLVGVALVSLWVIYGNAFYRFLHGQGQDVFKTSESGVDFALKKLSKPEVPGYEDTLYFPLKVSFPISFAPQGCEFIYGKAFYEFPKQKAQYLFRFAYDLKNTRCESMDLFLEETRLPQKIRIQFVNVSFDSKTIRESLREQEFILEPERAKASSTTNEVPILKVGSGSLSEREIQLGSSTVSRAPKFSKKRPDKIIPLISPRDNIQAEILNEIDKRTVKCKATKNCDPIRVAVAFFTDNKILEALEKANKAGIRVEGITNFDKQNETAKFQPFQWLRGNPFRKMSGFLPMHTKFIVFGEDVVISSNSNYDFDNYGSSRELALRYEDKEIALMFVEVFSLVRTTLFSPLKVDMNDGFLLLLNAERPRGYSAMDKKPYLAYETEQGRGTSAYGILFYLLDTIKGKLKLAMSPISNSCSFFEVKRCFFDILKNKINDRQFKIVMNVFFYVDPELKKPEKLRNLDPDEQRQSSVKSVTRKALGRKWGEISRNILLDENTVSMFSLFDRPISTHHERWGLLGDDYVLFGSANYATLGTYNTIEILRDKTLFETVNDEFESFWDPYSIVVIQDFKGEFVSYRDCGFVFEKDLLENNATPKTYHFSKKEIQQALDQKYGVSGSDWKIVLPEMNVSPTQFTKIPVTEKLESPSADLCLESPRWKTTRAIHINPRKT